MMDFDTPPTDPIEQCHEWLRDAEQIGLGNPNSATLCTVDPDGRPSGRVVLLKQLDDRGAVFYTNRDSRKGHALAANPFATLVFHWDALERQIVMEGTIEDVSTVESDTYFASRPRASQIGAWASRQSEPVSDRAELDAAYTEAEKRFEGADVPRPEFWGGYRINLETITIWQGRPFRLHDRMRYTKTDGAWAIRRIYP